MVDGGKRFLLFSLRRDDKDDERSFSHLGEAVTVRLRLKTLRSCLDNGLVDVKDSRKVVSKLSKDWQLTHVEKGSAELDLLESIPCAAGTRVC